MALTEPVPYLFDGAPVRIVVREGEPWFVAGDVARTLGYRDAPTLTRNLDADDAATHNLCIRSQNGVTQSRAMTIINESGLYVAIFASRRPTARAFKRWVTTEVLPSIRKTGRYATPSAPDPEAALASQIRLVELALQIKGPDAAKDLWRQLALPGFDTVMGAPPPQPVVAQAPWDCLATLMAYRLPTGTVAELLADLQSPMADVFHADASKALGQLGLRIEPRRRAAVAISNTSPRLEAVYHGTVWARRGWRQALLALPGATRGDPLRFSRHHLARTALVPLGCFRRWFHAAEPIVLSRR